MAETAEELVGRCYRRLLSRKGITKGAGTTVIGHYELMAEVVAEVGVMWDKQMKRTLKQLKANGERIRALAEAQGVMTQPLVPGVAGLVGLDLEQHGLRLAKRKPRASEDPRYYPGHSADQAANNDGN